MTTTTLTNIAATIMQAEDACGPSDVMDAWLGLRDLLENEQQKRIAAYLEASLFQSASFERRHEMLRALLPGFPAAALEQLTTMLQEAA